MGIVATLLATAWRRKRLINTAAALDRQALRDAGLRFLARERVEQFLQDAPRRARCPHSTESRMERELSAVLGCGIRAVAAECRPPRKRGAGCGGRHRRRSFAGSALQSAGAGSRIAEHEPGHQRGRPRTTPGGMESALRGAVRFPGRTAGGRPSHRRPHPLGLAAHAASRFGRGRVAAAHRFHARRHRAPDRARVPGRQHRGDPRQSDARRRFRRHLYRCHRLAPGRTQT